MNLIKKFFSLFAAVLFTFGSCAKPNELKPPSRIYDVDGPKVETLLKDLIKAIDTKDNEKIKSFFSVYAQTNANDLDDQIEYLISIVEGEVINVNISSMSSGESWENGSVIAMAGGRGRFITDVRAYQIFYWIYTENDVDHTREGIHCIQIIPQEVDTFVSSKVWPECDTQSFENAPVGVIYNQTEVKSDINEDGVLAKEKLERLVCSLETQNVSAAASAFSLYTQRNTDHFDEDVLYLMSIFKGNIVSLDWSSLHDGAYYNLGAFSKTASGWVEITTDINVYRLYCYTFLTSREDSSKEGIYRLQLVPKELWTEEIPAWLWLEYTNELENYSCGIIRNEFQ